MYFKKKYNYNSDLPEGRHTNGSSRIMYQANINSIEELVIMKAELSVLGDPQEIGVWYQKGINKGLQQGYYREDIGTIEEPNLVVRRNMVMNELGQEEEEPIHFQFDIEEYRKYLLDVPDQKDEEGNTISWRRPTIEEARHTHVNSFGGIIRDLNSYL